MIKNWDIRRYKKEKMEKENYKLSVKIGNGFTFDVWHGVFGFAIGDAVGVPYEFQARDSFRCKDMVGCDERSAHKVPMGTWSDDTSLLLCVLDACCEETEQGMFQKWSENAVSWMYEGNFSCTDMPFDIGYSVRLGISSLKTGRENYSADDEDANGNGGLMRVLPLAFLEYEDDEGLMQLIRLFNSCSHNHMVSHVGCLIYVKLLKGLCEGCGKTLRGVLRDTVRSISEEYKIPEYARIWDLSLLDCRRDEIKSSGYVVDTLEAAIWCVAQSQDYEKAILKAVNLGNDTDTVAAVCGGMAGVMFRKIPERWMKGLGKRKMIEEVLRKFEQSNRGKKCI